jgi:hypothetical protein
MDNQKTVAVKTTNKIKSKFSALRNSIVTFIAIAMMNLMAVPAFAGETTEAPAATDGAAAGDTMWTEIVGFVGTWIPRLGGFITLLGLVMFGLGWQRDDADGKSRGIQVAIGGAIVFAVGFMADTFMA